MKPEEKQQAEEFIRIGASALMHNKPLEEVLNIVTTGLSVIEKLRAVETVKSPAKTNRKKT